jgi:hypothetical protein
MCLLPAYPLARDEESGPDAAGEDAAEFAANFPALVELAGPSIAPILTAGM